MKFELKVYNTNISAEEAVADILTVSEILKKQSFTREEYQKYGKFHPASLTKKFGSWQNALNSAGLNYTRHGLPVRQYLGAILRDRQLLRPVAGEHESE